MRSIQLEVTKIAVTEALDVATIVDGKKTQGARIEEITLRVPFPTEEESNFQVGNVVGRVRGEEFTILVTDPEMFGRFKVGQRIKLA
jgi:hypothetical protein